MKRYTCKICNKKRNESELTKISSLLKDGTVWSCKNHTSIFADVSGIRTETEKPVFFEIFCGSKHISNHAEKLGFEVFNLDFESKFNATFTMDVTKFKTELIPRRVHVVHASVPCTVFSTMSLAHHWQSVSIGYRQYYYIPKTPEAVEALRILNKTLRIIAELNPIYYFIENPRGGLRHFPQMKLIPYRKTVSYADFGFNYYKPTDLFTNCPNFKPVEIRGCMGRKFESSVIDLKNAYQRSLIPPQLIEEIFNSFKSQFGLS